MIKRLPTYVRAARVARPSGSPTGEHLTPNAGSLLPLPAETPKDAVPVTLLRTLTRSYLLDCDMNRHSERTTTARRDLLAKLAWFLDREGITLLDVHALRAFFHHVTHGHEEPGGRWGNPHMSRAASAGTLATYFRYLRAFLNWCVKEGALCVSPMDKLTPPVDRPDQVQPFSPEQIGALIAAARASLHPVRNEAIILLLLDTGLRATELVTLRVSDVDLWGGQITVRMGKGGKSRRVPFSTPTRRALYQCLNERESAPGEMFFLADRGEGAGGGLGRRGLLKLMHRLGAVAGIEASARCCPHTWRHTFAVSYLRAGGNVFALKELLGHTSLTIVNRYVNLANADLATAHAKFSPVLLMNSEGRG